MIVPKMMRYESVAVFLVTYSLFISSISNTCQVQSFTPSLSSSSSSSIRPSTLFQDTKHNNQNFLPSRVTDNLPSHRITISSSTGTTSTSTTIRLSDWSGFEALDDDDDLRDDFLDNGQPVGGFADENDEQERKAEVGNALPRPEVYWDGEPIFLPQGESPRVESSFLNYTFISYFSFVSALPSSSSFFLCLSFWIHVNTRRYHIVTTRTQNTRTVRNIAHRL